MTHNEMIAVIQAHKEGKTIQTRLRDGSEANTWYTPVSVRFNFAVYDYRVKKEPRVRWMIDVVDRDTGRPIMVKGFVSKEHAARYLERKRQSRYYNPSEPYEVVERI